MRTKKKAYHEMTALVFPTHDGQGSLLITRATDMQTISENKYHVIEGGIFFLGTFRYTRKQIESRYKRWDVILPDSFCYECVLADKEKITVG